MLFFIVDRTYIMRSKAIIPFSQDLFLHYQIYHIQGGKKEYVPFGEYAKIS